MTLQFILRAKSDSTGIRFHWHLFVCGEMQHIVIFDDGEFTRERSHSNVQMLLAAVIVSVSISVTVAVLHIVHTLSRIFILLKWLNLRQQRQERSAAVTLVRLLKKSLHHLKRDKMLVVFSTICAFH